MISCTASVESTGTTRPAPAVVLQRKCARGEAQGFGGGRKPLCGNDLQDGPSRDAGGSAAIPPAVRAALHSAGRPLDPSARALLEPGFGHDFSTVRVHADAAAADSAAAIGALAYTVGSHVFFAGGQYAPHTRGGRHLLAHELAHVVQQGGDTGNLMRKSISDLVLGDEDAAAEREADGAADRIMRGEKASVGLSTRDTLQRAPVSHTPAVVGLDPSGPDADLGGKTEDALWECMKGAAPIPQDCPQAPLTWGDYPVVRGGAGSARIPDGS